MAMVGMTLRFLKSGGFVQSTIAGMAERAAYLSV